MVLLYSIESLTGAGGRLVFLSEAAAGGRAWQRWLHAKCSVRYSTVAE